MLQAIQPSDAGCNDSAQKVEPASPPHAELSSINVVRLDFDKSKTVEKSLAGYTIRWLSLQKPSILLREKDSREALRGFTGCLQRSIQGLLIRVSRRRP